MKETDTGPASLEGKAKEGGKEAERDRKRHTERQESKQGGLGSFQELEPCPGVHGEQLKCFK